MQQHLKTWYSPGFAYEPGHLYVNMLLSGDRKREFGSARLTSGYDGLTGAGLLRLRRFDEWGLDAPYSWSSGNACVEHGHIVNVQLGEVPVGVDIIKAVAWFYDPKHDDATWEWMFPSYHQTIDLALEYLDGTQWVTFKEDAGGTDNKRRVANDIPLSVAYDWRIRLIGTHVEIDSQCGDDAARVYWAFYFEDHAHDGGSPLMNFIRPE